MLKSKSSQPNKQPQKTRIFRRLESVLFILLFLIFSVAFIREFEKVNSQSINSWTEDITADCAVVLTGGSNRVREGLDLLSRGQVRKLIISGVYSNAQLREIFPLWPFYGNVQEKDVVLDRRSTTTYGNAQQSLPIVEALGCRDVALVTSNLHMYRAFRTFQAAYPAAVGISRFAVNSGRSEANLLEVSTEVLKSLFYSLWAY
jgi:uncharacterized SAM-binding protein YcdF (DUF218 family)